MTFAEQLKSHVERIGTARAAAICGVTPRSIQLWLRGASNVNAATRAGALLLLSKEKKPL
jgi:hypothetical protein